MRVFSTLVLVVIFFSFLFPVAPVIGKIIYVDDDANGLNDGSSWIDAYKYLQDALADANSSEKPVEILVAQGIYKPDQGTNQTPGKREATFQLINGVALKGGHLGCQSQDPNSRNIWLNKTILSGDLGANDINIDSAWQLSMNPYFMDNTCHILTSIGIDETVVLDGFIIEGGYASDYLEDRYPYGGGIYCINSNLKIISCTFNRNLAYLGGGMYNQNGNPTLIGCTFSENYAEMAGEGGGIYNEHSGATLTECIFKQNVATGGGGVYNHISNLKLYYCNFTANWVFHDGGGMCNHESNPVLMGCIFTDNLSPHHGGAGMYNALSSPILIDCTFSNNSAETVGGSIRNFNSNLVLTTCAFNHNFAAEYGAGIDNEESIVELNKCVFTKNSTAIGGGAGLANGYRSKTVLNNCIFSGNYSPDYEVLLNWGGQLTVTNCTFVGNRSGTYTLSCGGSREHQGSTYIISCIFYDGKREIFNGTNSVVIIKYCDVQGGRSAVYDFCEGVVWGEGNIDEDPCFILSGYWDDNDTTDELWDDIWLNGGYHLKSQAGRWDPNTQTWVKDDVTSPCIDAGDPMSPIDLEPFPNGGRINMGAYGGTLEASKSYFGQPPCEAIIAGDINGDCKIDFKDFAILALHWLQEPNP